MNYRPLDDTAHRRPPSEGEYHEPRKAVARTGWKEFESRPASPSQESEGAKGDKKNGIVIEKDGDNEDGDEVVVTCMIWTHSR
jgi:hypothetical protein